MTSLNISDVSAAIAPLAITGAVVSVLAQITKKWLEGKAQRALYVLGLSLVGGGAIYLFQFVPAAWWQVALGVYAAANTMYLVVMQWLPKQEA